MAVAILLACGWWGADPPEAGAVGADASVRVSVDGGAGRGGPSPNPSGPPGPAAFLESFEVEATFVDGDAAAPSAAVLRDGAAVLRLRRPGGASPVVDLGSTPLGLASLRTDGGEPAAGGRSADGRLLVHCRESTQTVRSVWFAAGVAVGETVQFRLRLPPALRTVLRLRVPRGLRVDAGGAVVTAGPPRGGGRARTWEVRTGRRRDLTLVVSPDVAVYEPSRLLTTQAVAYRVAATEVSWRAELQVESSGSARQSVTAEFRHLGLPAGADYVLESASLNGRRIPNARTVRAGDRRTLEIAIASPGVSRIELRGTAPWGPRLQRLPEVRLAGGQLVSGSASVVVEPPLRAERVLETGYRRTGTVLDDGGDELRFERTGVSASLRLKTAPPPPVMTASVLTRIDDRGPAGDVRNVIRLRPEAGQAFDVPLLLPEGLRVVDAKGVGGNRLTSWSEGRDLDGRRTLTVSFSEPLAAASAGLVEVRGVLPESRPGSAFRVPAVRPAAAATTDGYLLVLGPEGGRAAPADGAGVEELSGPRFAAETPLAESARLPGSGFKIYAGVDAETVLVRPRVPFPAADPREADAAPRGAATLSLEARVPASAGDAAVVSARFELRPAGGAGVWTFRLPPGVAPSSASVDGRPVTARRDADRPTAWTVPRPPGARTLTVVYHSAPPRGWLNRDFVLPVPVGPAPVEGYRLAVDSPAGWQTTRLSPGGPLTRRDWRTRLFGPLARRVGDPVFGSEDPPAAAAGDAGPPRGGPRTVAAGFRPPERFVLTGFDRRKASAYGWVALSVCLSVGCLLRQHLVGARRRAAFWWWSACASAAWLVPDGWSLVAGGAAVGTLISSMVPRRLLGGRVAPRPPVSATLTAAAVCAGLAWFWPAGVAAGDQPAAATGDLTDAGLQGDALGDEPLLNELRYELSAGTAGGTAVDVRLSYWTSGRRAAVRLPIPAGVTMEPDGVTRDGRRVDVIPLGGGVLLPLSRLPGLQDFRLRLSVSPEAAAAGLPTPAAVRVRRGDPPGAVGIHGGVPSEDGVLVEAGSRVRLRVGVDPAAPVAWVDRTVEVKPLSAAIGYRFVFGDAADRPRPVRIRFPAGSVVTGGAGPASDAYLRVSRTDAAGTTMLGVLPAGKTAFETRSVVPRRSEDAVTVSGPEVFLDGREASLRYDRPDGGDWIPGDDGDLVLPARPRGAPEALRVDHTGTFVDGRLDWTVRVRLDAAGGGPVGREFDLPRPLRVRGVSATAGGEVLPCRWSRDGTRLTVLTETPAAGPRQILVEGVVPFRPGRAQVLPAIRPRSEAPAEFGDLVLSNRSRFAVRLLGERLGGVVGGEPLRIGGWRGSGPTAFTAALREAESAAEWATIYPPGGGAVLACRVEGGAEGLTFSEPAARLTAVRAADAAGRPLETDSGGGLAVRARGTPGPVTVRGELADAGVGRVPALRPSEGRVSGGFVCVAEGRGLAVLPPAEPAATPPAWVRELLPGGVTWSVHSVGEAGATVGPGERPTADAEIEAVQAVLFPDRPAGMGGVTDVRLSGGGAVRIRKRAALRVTSVWTDGVPAAASDGPFVADRLVRVWWESTDGSMPGVVGGPPPEVRVGTPGWAAVGEAADGGSGGQFSGAAPGGGVNFFADFPAVVAGADGRVRLSSTSPVRAVAIGLSAAGLLAVLLYLLTASRPAAAEAAERLARRPLLATLLLAFFWWAFLKPSVAGPVIAAAGGVWALWRSSAGRRPLRG